MDKFSKKQTRKHVWVKNILRFGEREIAERMSLYILNLFAYVEIYIPRSGCVSSHCKSWWSREY